MYYTIYRITNKLNGKFYIGKHKTSNLDDGYMGSGKLIRRAIKKYGPENFSKEILHVFETEEEMNDKEQQMVVLREDSYNLVSGGKGGFDYINRMGLRKPESFLKGGLAYKQKLEDDPEFKKRMTEKFIQTVASGYQQYKQRAISEGTFNKHWIGRKHTEETKRKIGTANSKLIGSKNGSFGTCWITNGIENKKIKKEDLTKYEVMGYTRGRVC